MRLKIKSLASVLWKKVNMNNEELNKLNIHINKECCLCGRKYPQTILNIEGIIHHNSKIKCLDVKKCNKYKRKGINE